jgi:hypothetical protein
VASLLFFNGTRAGDRAGASRRESGSGLAILASRALLVVAVLLSLGSGGCASFRGRMVKPHQRVYLSDRIMRLDGERLSRAADEHVLNTREGAYGGTGTAGGGCGCN